MAIEIVPYFAAAAAEAQAFNARLRAGGEYEFQLPNTLPAASDPGAAIRNEHFVATEGDAVRGGFLLATFPAAFADGESTDVINCREPLSEGIVDSKYSLVGLRLLKHIQRQGPYIFALGMGSEENRFPRLLKGAGWTVDAVPFLFRVVRVNRFLSELRRLQEGKLKAAAAFARMSGVGKIGLSALQASSIVARVRASGFHLEPVTEWGSWADELWESFRTECAFGVRRDVRTLRELYQLGKDHSSAFVIKRGGQAAGWVAVQSASLQNHKYFGSMRVATILDNVALPEARNAAVSLVCDELARDGADLIVTNQSFTPWITAFRAAGFLTTKSNYILATSKKLTARIDEQPGARAYTHFTRGDADGRYHLLA